MTGAVVLLVTVHARAGTPVTGFTDDPVATGLSAPTAIAFLPDGTLVVTEKGGAVKIASNGTGSVVGTIPVCTDSEMGLLGIAVDPGYAMNHRIYLYRSWSATNCGSATGRANEVVRTTLANGALGPVDVLLTGIRTDGGNHDGGCLRIGPDGMLYVGAGDSGVGDGGAPGDSTNPYAQDLGSLNGKLLRLALDGSVPAANPFAGQVGKRGEIWAYGFRNPFRFGFDPLTGALWVGDVGQSTREEIDRAVAGGNHSWPYCEGTLPAACAHPGDVVPLWDYDHNGNSASITGGAFAVGGTLFGDYFFGDYVLGTIWHATPTVGRDAFAGTPVETITNAGGPVDIVFGPDGALYYVAIGDGEVRRVTSAGFGPPVATTTTTTTSSSTTTSTSTTLPGAPCAGEPTFDCVRAALDQLAAAVGALGDVGTVDDRLAARLARIRTAVDAAEAAAGGGRTAAARAALKRAIRGLAGVRALLASPQGRRRVQRDARVALFPLVDGALDAVRGARSAL